MTIETTYLRATADAASRLKTGFIAVYQEAFGGAPYFEHYTEAEVAATVWEPHTTHGIVILALQHNQVIGLGCALPLLAAPTDIQEHLRASDAPGGLALPWAHTWYMSELGVLEPFRRQGIGARLIRERLVRIGRVGGTHYVLRTAAAGSNSAGLYRRLGAIDIAQPQDVSSSDQVQTNQSHSTTRIYLAGRCTEALARG